jgi:adenosine deaminase
VTKAYLTRAAADNVRYAEIQARVMPMMRYMSKPWPCVQIGSLEHTRRGVSLETMLKGMRRAMDEARSSLGIHSAIIEDLIKASILTLSLCAK